MDMNKKLKNEYIYRTHRNNSCNYNCISNLDTEFHPVSPVDELTEGSWSFCKELHPQLINSNQSTTGQNNETRQQR